MHKRPSPGNKSPERLQYCEIGGGNKRTATEESENVAFYIIHAAGARSVPKFRLNRYR